MRSDSEIYDAYLTYMLPNQIIKELFTVKYKVSDIVVDHIIEELNRFNCIPTNISDYDTSIIIEFGKIGDFPIEGELRIDRLNKQFEICAFSQGNTFLPAYGDWHIIEEYLNQLVSFKE